MSDVREQQAWSAYRRMRQAVDAAIARDLDAATGLSLPDYDVLDTLASIDDDCVKVNALAARMNWSRSRLSRQLGRMERRGLIAREPCDRDRRGDDVVITPAGQAAATAASPIHWESVRRHFVEPLSRSQADTLAEIAAALDAHHTPHG